MIQIEKNGCDYWVTEEQLERFTNAGWSVKSPAKAEEPKSTKRKPLKAKD